MSEVGRDDVDAGAVERPAEDAALWLSGDNFAAEPGSVADGLAIRPTELELEPLDGGPPGPGLPESLAWMGGMFGLQIVGGIIAVAAVTLMYLIDTGSIGKPGAGGDPSTSAKTLELIQREYAGLMFGIIQAVTVVGAATAVFLRLGRQRRRLLPLAPMPWRHAALLFAAMLPLIVLSSQLHIAASEVWKHITDLLPALKGVDDVSSIAFVEKMARRTSFLGLLLMVAVAPAIAEELVFRGAIGRGLIARWGLPGGIVITSLLFAAMHVHPPHVVALIPLAAFIHVSYVATRSFWAPMVVHFLNNAFAVLVLSVLLENPETVKQAADQSPQVSWLMLGCSGFCVAMLTVSLWRSRVEFVDWYGTEWSPGYSAVERPPEDWGLHARCRPTEVKDWLPAAVGLAVFVLGAMLFGVLAQQELHV